MWHLKFHTLHLSMVYDVIIYKPKQINQSVYLLF
jgi:hypothetical protein